MAFVTETYRPFLTLRERVAEMNKTYRERADKRRVYRQTLNELRALSPRELDDIGINASMITGIAHDAAYGSN